MARIAGMNCPNCRKQYALDSEYIILWVLVESRDQCHYKAEFLCPGCLLIVMENLLEARADFLADHGVGHQTVLLEGFEDPQGVDGMLDTLQEFLNPTSDLDAEFMEILDGL